jgi:tetratricopeptide (TPR) repeat protein
MARRPKKPRPARGARGGAGATPADPVVSAATPQRKSRIETLAKSISYLVSAFLVVLFLWVFFDEWFAHYIVIEDISAPKFLDEKHGYSPRTIAEKIRDNVDRLRNKSAVFSKGIRQRYDVRIESEFFDVVEIAGTKISARALARWVLRQLDISTDIVTVSGYVTADKGGDLHMTLRVHGSVPKSLAKDHLDDLEHPYFPPRDKQFVDKSLNESAVFIWKYTQPYILSAYYYRYNKLAESESIANFCALHCSDEEKLYARNILALIEMDRGGEAIDRAEAMFKNIIQDAKNSGLRVTAPYVNLGKLYILKKNWPKARQYIEEAAKINDNDAYVFWGLGILEANVAKSLQNAAKREAGYRAAIAHYERAIKFDSALVPAYVGLGVIHIRLVEYDKAIQRLKQAIALDDEEPFSRINIAQALVARGSARDVEEARHHLQAALRMSLSPKTRIFIRERLKHLR